MASISTRVYVDDPAQPSGPGHTYLATINVSNQHHIFFEGGDSVEKIVIHDPHALGMKSNKQKDRHEFIERVTIACNLLLKRSRLSIHPAGTDIADFVPTKTKNDNATVEDGPVIPLDDTVVVTDSVSIGIYGTDELDETDVCDVLGMIYAVYNDKKHSQKVDNMRAALMEYSRGIRAQDRETVLKGLYAAADMAVNFDKGEKREKSGKKLDSAMLKLVDDQTIEINKIRVAVGRLKRAAPKEQLPDYPDAETVHKYVRALRPASSSIILRRLEELTGNHHAALFLGAGASAFASQPATIDLMNRVRRRVQERNAEPPRDDRRQNYIMGVVNNDQIYKDVENLYDGIDQIVNAGTNHNCGPITAGILHGSTGLQYEEIIDELKRLRGIIHEVLRKSFTIKDGDFAAIKQVYGGIWSVMQDKGVEKFQVFTTNYDNVIEEYCDMTGRDIVNGFKPYRYGKRVWSKAWEHGGSKSALHLIKLHGSIFWHKDGDGRIVEPWSEESDDPDNIIIIPPTEGAKDYRREPFPTIMNHFREVLKEVDVLVVIGFSYRDGEIVEIIKERLRGGMALISISRSAGEAKKLDPNAKISTKKVNGIPFTLIGSKIILYETEFDPSTIKDVKTALKVAYNIIQDGVVPAVGQPNV